MHITVTQSSGHFAWAGLTCCSSDWWWIVIIKNRAGGGGSELAFNGTAKQAIPFHMALNLPWCFLIETSVFWHLIYTLSRGSYAYSKFLGGKWGWRHRSQNLCSPLKQGCVLALDTFWSDYLLSAHRKCFVLNANCSWIFHAVTEGWKREPFQPFSRFKRCPAFSGIE